MCSTILFLAGVLSAVAAVPGSERISGGATTTIALHPFAASLSYNRLGVGVFQFSCGGAIISNRAVLTSAYCIYNEPTYRYRVRVGIATASAGGVLNRVDYILVHPRYNPVTKENDIGILHVNPHFIFTNNVQFGTVAAFDYNLPFNQTVWGIGWGVINHGGALSETLRRVELWVLDNKICKARYEELDCPTVTPKMVCASGLDVSGRGQCLGDNGSPLLHDRLIIGVYSWGHQCGNLRYPGVNTYVPVYSNWIKANW